MAMDVPVSCALVCLVEEGTQKATKRETWATIQKSSHKTWDLEASCPIICAAKTRKQSINAPMLLSALSFSFSPPLFGMGLLTSINPIKRSFNFLLPWFLYCNLELSAKETLSSLNCCCGILDHSNREQNLNRVSRQQDEEVWKKMMFYYHGWLCDFSVCWQPQRKARECLGHPWW